MDELKFSAFDAQGRMLPFSEVIDRLSKSTAKLTEQKRASAITTIFGQEAMSGILALMEQGPDKLKNLTDELYASQGAAKKMADTRLDSMQGSFVVLQSAIEGAKLQIGEKLAPSVRSIADRIANELPGAVEQFERRYQAMTNSIAWNNADAFGKFQIAWNKLIGEPLGIWWESQGKAQVSRIASELAKTFGKAVKGTIKEALSFKGASSLMAAGALAVPGIKVGKGVTATVRTLKNIGQAGSSAAGGVGAATRSAGMLGSAISLLANPVGAAVAGVGLLAGGVYLYKRNQEKARQELINMGSQLREAADQYQFVADKSEKTQELVQEYRDLSAAVEGNVGTAEELVEKQERLAEVIQQLQDLHPETITQYDIENDKIKEKLGLLQQESEAELELARLRLEKEIAEKSRKLPKLEKEMRKLQEQKQSVEEQKDAFDQAIPALKQFSVEFQKLMREDASDERTEKLEQLRAKVNEVAETVGYYFNANSQLITLDDTINSLSDKRISLITDQITKIEELGKSQSSYEELYKAQKDLIEINLGAKLEDQAKKFNSLSDEEKQRFNEALVALDKLNKEMDLLDTEKQINVEVFYKQTGQTVPEGIGPQPMFKMPSYMLPMGLPGYADGGIANRPSIFGEDGPEIAIPIRNDSRSRSLLDTANRLIGRDGSGDINVTFAPQITVQGGGTDTAQQLQQALAQAQDEFERWFRAMIKQERRLSFQ